MLAKKGGMRHTSTALYFYRAYKKMYTNPQPIFEFISTALYWIPEQMLTLRSEYYATLNVNKEPCCPLQILALFQFAKQNPSENWDVVVH
jgi:hypothetical protein